MDWKIFGLLVFILSFSLYYSLHYWSLLEYRRKRVNYLKSIIKEYRKELSTINSSNEEDIEKRIWLSDKIKECEIRLDEITHKNKV